MKKGFRTSLIITTYNRKDALELVILSAFRQKKLPDEIIVADDGSGEDTAQLIQELQKRSPVPLIHCWHEDTGFRLSAARNLAISKSHYEYIIMVDGDMILHPYFIKSHLIFAKSGRFIQGPRVFLNEEATKEALKRKQIDFSFFSRGITTRLNTLYIPFLIKLISYCEQDLTRVRGCNQSFWRSDVLKINGFNEDFQGWGREDTEFTFRMMNNNLSFYKLKMGGFGFHLYHPHKSREMVAQNQYLLDQIVVTNSKRCQNGIDKYFIPA